MMIAAAAYMPFKKTKNMIDFVQKEVSDCRQSDGTDKKGKRHERESILPVSDCELDHGKQEKHCHCQPDNR
jgi:hypothetical protein